MITKDKIMEDIAEYLGVKVGEEFLLKDCDHTVYKLDSELGLLNSCNFINEAKFWCRDHMSLLKILKLEVCK